MEPVANRLKFTSAKEPEPTDAQGNKKYTLAEAYRYCKRVTKNHYENFPVASIAVPKKLRPHVCAVYAFARQADDFADEKEFEESRMQKLDEWEYQLENIFTKEPIHPVFMALRHTLKKFNIPAILFKNLLTAFKMDVTVSRYNTFNEVLNYCRYSANPVGRIILHLFGYPAPKFMEYSDSICTALQLTNFWQDIGLDLKKDRIYLPAEDLLHFRYSTDDLQNKLLNENFRRLMMFQCERTWDLFNHGKPLCAKIPGRLGYELRLTWGGGTTILKKIAEVQMDVFNLRPSLKKGDYWRIGLAGLRKKSFCHE